MKSLLREEVSHLLCLFRINRRIRFLCIMRRWWRRAAAILTHNALKIRVIEL